jgi:hypothetical protein
MTEVKETKAQRAERLKREKNLWEALDKIRSFARTGLLGSFEMRMRFQVYTEPRFGRPEGRFLSR